MTKVGSIAPGVNDRWGGGQVAGKWRNVPIDLLVGMCKYIYIHTYRRSVYSHLYIYINK